MVSGVCEMLETAALEVSSVSKKCSVATSFAQGRPWLVHLVSWETGPCCWHPTTLRLQNGHSAFCCWVPPKASVQGGTKGSSLRFHNNQLPLGQVKDGSSPKVNTCQVLFARFLHFRTVFVFTTFRFNGRRISKDTGSNRQQAKRSTPDFFFQSSDCKTTV